MQGGAGGGMWFFFLVPVFGLALVRAVERGLAASTPLGATTGAAYFARSLHIGNASDFDQNETLAQRPNPLPLPFPPFKQWHSDVAPLQAV